MWILLTRIDGRLKGTQQEAVHRNAAKVDACWRGDQDDAPCWTEVTGQPLGAAGDLWRSVSPIVVRLRNLAMGNLGRVILDQYAYALWSFVE